jgi:hypothetical protein
VTTESADGRALGAALAPYVADLEPPPDLYAALRGRRRRRRRIGTAGLAVLAVVAVAGSVLAAGARQDRSIQLPAVPTVRTSAVHGSLGNADLTVPHRVCAGAAHVAPARVKLQLAERSGDFSVVMGYAASGRWLTQCFAVRTGAGPWQPQQGYSGTFDTPAFDGQMGQRFYGNDPLLVQDVLVGDGERRYLLVVAPDDAQVLRQSRVTITAQARVQRSWERLPFRYGATLVDTDGVADAVRVLRAGRQVAGVADSQHGVAGVVPTSAEVTDALARARGNPDPKVANGHGDYELPHLGQLQRHYDILWGGPLPHGGKAVLHAVTFPSGASYLWEDIDFAGGYGSTALLGLVPAGAATHWVIAWKQVAARPHKDALVVVGPANAARAEAVLTNSAVVPVPLTEGGGAIEWPGTVVKVRVYDAAGNLLDQRAVGEGIRRPDR